MTIPLQSGADWEDDPAGNANSHDGRTIRRAVRAKNDHSRYALVKRPQPRHVATENYSIGMERVAYTLGTIVGLPVPETWLEDVDGHPSSVQRRIVEARSWRQVYGNTPQMCNRIENEDIYALAALFDVWMGNTDRRDVNLLFEALPEGVAPGRANGSRLWLIDHGCCGLWPANKYDVNRDPADIISDPAEIAAEFHQNTEAVIGAVMPPEYRMALKQAQGEDRALLLDRITGIKDDAVDAAIDEIPQVYISSGRAEATKAALKARRDALDTVLNRYW